jgi:hypothetical protein
VVANNRGRSIPPSNNSPNGHEYNVDIVISSQYHEANELCQKGVRGSKDAKVGAKDGADVGKEEVGGWTFEGAFVGWNVGTFVGAPVGEEVGLDGDEVGNLVGQEVGGINGDIVGRFVGTFVGVNVGLGGDDVGKLVVGGGVASHPVPSMMYPAAQD